jgi:hypothetical protein
MVRCSFRHQTSGCPTPETSRFPTAGGAAADFAAARGRSACYSREFGRNEGGVSGVVGTRAEGARDFPDHLLRGGAVVSSDPQSLRVRKLCHWFLKIYAPVQRSSNSMDSPDDASASAGTSPSTPMVPAIRMISLWLS